MSIIAASEAALKKLKVTPFDLNRFAVDQSISQLFSSRFQYAMDSRPRHMHLLGTFFLFQTF
jgi:hypothetical protein